MESTKFNRAENKINHTVRYPLHRGPFLFAPRFLSEAEWYSEFRSVILKVLERTKVEAVVLQPYDGRQARLELATVEFTVDAQGGVFALHKLGYSSSDDYIDELDVVERPVHFLDTIDARKGLVGVDYQRIRSVASLLFEYMDRRFERALREGYATITAHVKSSMSPPSVLALWQIQRMTFSEESYVPFFLEDDFEFDHAVSPDGIDVYGIGVVPMLNDALKSERSRVARPRVDGPNNAKKNLRYDPKIINPLVDKYARLTKSKAEIYRRIAADLNITGSKKTQLEDLIRKRISGKKNPL